MDYPQAGAISPEKQFEQVANSMSKDEKMDFLMKTVMKSRGMVMSPAGSIGGSGGGLDVDGLAKGLSEGLANLVKSVGAKNVETHLDKLKRSDAQDFYEICHWLIRAEQDPDIERRIRTALAKGSEITEIAKVAKAVKESDLSGEDRWVEFVKLVCNAVRPGYLSDVASDINKPERFSTADEAKRAVSKRFEAFAWLAGMFPAMKNLAGVGDLAKATMLMGSLPEEMERAVEESMDVLEAHQKTFMKVSQLVAKKSKRNRERDWGEDTAVKSPTKRVAQRIGKPTRVIWAANAVQESEEPTRDLCQMCGDTGHTAPSCPDIQLSAAATQQSLRPPMTCYNCGEPGHISRECPKPQRPRTRGQTLGQRCYNCGQNGHIAAECLSKQGTPVARADVRRCYNCGQPGHISRNCPSRNVTPPGPPNYPPPGFPGQGSLNH